VGETGKDIVRIGKKYFGLTYRRGGAAEKAKNSLRNGKGDRSARRGDGPEEGSRNLGWVCAMIKRGKLGARKKEAEKRVTKTIQ